MDDAPIKIVLSHSGGKLSLCSVGEHAAATWTFICDGIRDLAAEIQQARAEWLQMKRLSGTEPTPEQIFEWFPEIRRFCTVNDVLHYVRDGGLGDNRFRTPLQAAQEIMEKVFPTLSRTYIQRAGRKRTKPQKDSKPL